MAQGLKAPRLLEQQTEGVFRLFWHHAPALIGHEFTIIAFDYGDAGSVAWKTSLSIKWLIASFERLVASWSGGPAVYAPAGVRPLLLRDLASAIKKALPATIGFAIVVGTVDRLAYVSFADRDGVQKTIETVLLPQWRKESVS